MAVPLAYGGSISNMFQRLADALGFAVPPYGIGAVLVLTLALPRDETVVYSHAAPSSGRHTVTPWGRSVRSLRRPYDPSVVGPLGTTR